MATVAQLALVLVALIGVALQFGVPAALIIGGVFGVYVLETRARARDAQPPEEPDQ